jgi:hypothetical protein
MANMRERMARKWASMSQWSSSLSTMLATKTAMPSDVKKMKM